MFKKIRGNEATCSVARFSSQSVVILREASPSLIQMSKNRGNEATCSVAHCSLFKSVDKSKVDPSKTGNV